MSTKCGMSRGPSATIQVLSVGLQLLPPLHGRQVMGIQINNVVNAIVYAGIGIVIFARCISGAR